MLSLLTASALALTTFDDRVDPFKLRGDAASPSKRRLDAHCEITPDANGHVDWTSNTVHNDAFRGCKELKSISLPATLESINKTAFYDSGLTSIDLSHTSLTSISGWAFGGCKELKSISLPATLESIDQAAFAYCTALTSIDLSQTSLTSISNSAFYNCKDLYSISLPATLESIDTSLFRDSGLTSIDLSHTSLTSLSLFAFSGCTELKSVSLPATLETIDPFAFQACTALTSICLPQGVTSVDTPVCEGVPVPSECAAQGTGLDICIYGPEYPPPRIAPALWTGAISAIATGGAVLLLAVAGLAVWCTCHRGQKPAVPEARLSQTLDPSPDPPPGQQITNSKPQF